MNAALSLLGAALLILIGVAFVLAVVILILYEARWAVRLGKQFSCSTADEASVGAEPQNEHGEP